MNLKKLFTVKLPLLALAVLLLALTAKEEPKVWTSSSQPLKEMEQIRKLIIAPKFKNQEFNIIDFGAKADGVTMNTEAFKKAIEACNAAGGGKVVVPSGNFLTGPIYLKSNVNLHLKVGSTILFSQNPKDYPIVLTRWEGMDCMNYSPQIYAYNEKNIAITGSGTINGNADKKHWWPWKGRKQYGWKEGIPNQLLARDSLHLMMKKNVDPRKRVFGEGHYLRPYMIQPYNCKNLLISGVTLIDSPMWFLSPVMCENITIEKVRIDSEGPNTDGCDPDACKNVLIKDCYLNTGDDCIAIKSGRDEDGRGNKKPAENHIIEGCEMKNGHGGIVIGSEIAGGAKNIYAINCKMDSKNLDRVLRVKTSSSRGGIIENIFLKDISVGSYGESAIHFNMFYENPGNFMPVIRNIWIENMNVEKGGEYAVFVDAYAESPVTNLKIVNCNFKGVKKSFKVNHVKNMELQNVTINGQLAKFSDASKTK
ncbi:glycoside hydrolase family 28 protein [Flavobacterium sufflavum]|uniref:Glycoside hydrolase family 28 protein n=1 Tax=Flavobacterium sufflavum TaxID=1921138 RepID=A0A437KLP0_9FLAO|nr:glycoside hydrolase family 28 protein [Flavobacterium sufflavum]RVT72001.1 glycoside hydrolase family 28 protein [Flavobacterium sufflavum]